MRVVKLGGRPQADGDTVAAIAASWSATPRALCIVHGGGDEISAVQRKLGYEPQFTGGRRVTSERDIDLVRMVLSGAANKRLVAALLSAGVPAWGVSGEDGGLLTARLTKRRELGLVGETPRVDAKILGAMLELGYLPVISPLAHNADGPGALNVNGDDAAAAIAAAIGAAELLFVSDVAGVLEGDGTPISRLDLERADDLVARGVIADGMAAKLEAARAALAAGVSRVRIGTVEMMGDSTAGTSVTSTAEVLI